jgi:glycosyltransferase involved in cell wall biosynthesis
MPRVSIVIPMRNCERFVEQTLRALLSQQRVEMEIVVVDDGSTDRSADVVKSIADPRIRLVPGPRSGIAAAVNAGLSHATGDYFCRCDADDWYEPDRLARQVNFLQANPDYGAVCGQYTMTNPAGQIVDRLPRANAPEEITAELRDGRGRTHLNTFMVRMPLLRRLNGFRPYFIGTEDNDFQLRLSDITRIWYEPIPSYLYRLHGASITHTQSGVQRKFLEKTAREFQLQRQATGADDLDRGTPPPVPTDQPAEAEKVEQHLLGVMIGRSWREHRAGKKREAIAIGLRACLNEPMRWKAWRNVVMLLMKRPGGVS